jgi:hypothetical protein
LFKASIEYSGSTVKVFDLVCAAMLLMAMLSFHRNLHRSLLAAQQQDFNPVYYTYASLIGILFVVNLAILLLPFSQMTLNVSRLAFVAQGFAMLWIWFYMGLSGRQTNRATLFALIVGAAYTSVLVWPWEKNSGGNSLHIFKGICPLQLPNKSTVLLYWAIACMLMLGTAVIRAEVNNKPLKCYSYFLLVVFAIQAIGSSLIVFASADIGVCIFNFVQLLYAITFPPVLYTVMQWDSQEVANEKQREVLSPLLMSKGDKPVTGAAIKLYELLKNVHVCKDVGCSDKIGEGAYGQVYVGLYLNTRVAVKKFGMLPELDDATMQSIVGELELATTLRHPHIVQYLGVAVEDNLRYSTNLCIHSPTFVSTVPPFYPQSHLCIHSPIPLCRRVFLCPSVLRNHLY